MKGSLPLVVAAKHRPSQHRSVRIAGHRCVASYPVSVERRPNKQIGLFRDIGQKGMPFRKQGSSHHVYFSTVSRASSTASHEQETEEYFNTLRKLSNARQCDKAEDYFYRVVQNNEAVSSSEILACQNLVLWGWSKSSDLNAPERSQKFLTNMKEPNMASYQYVLGCWSRAKKHKQAGYQAEKLLRRLQKLGLQDQWKAYHLVIKACVKANDGDRATKLLQEMLHNQNDQGKINKHVVTTVLMALKSKPHQAEALMHHLEAEHGLALDTVHYATVMDAWAYSRNGPRCEVLLQKMMDKGVKPSIAIYNAVLFSWRNNLDRMETLFQKMMTDYVTCSYRDSSPSNGVAKNGQVRRSAVQPNVNSLSIVLDAQAQAKAPDRAEALLAWIIKDPDHTDIIQPNIVCLSSVLNAWVRINEPERAERLLRDIEKAGFEPNAVMYTVVLNGWASQGNIDRTEAIWNEMVEERNIQPNLHTINTYLLAYANARQPQAAQKALKYIREQFKIEPDPISYTTVLRACQLADKPDHGRQLLREIEEREKQEGIELLDTLSYNTVIQSYSQLGMAHEAEKLLHEMIENNTNPRTRPNVQSFCQVMTAYARSKDARLRSVAGTKAEQLWDKMENMGIRPNLIALNVLLQCFSKSGNPEHVEATLRKIIASGEVEVDVISYNTCLQAWAQARNAERAEQLFFEMVSNGAKRSGGGNGKRNIVYPDVKSCSIVLSAWAKQATLDAAEHAESILRHMHAMGESCEPDTISYNTVIQAWLKLAKRVQKNCSDTEYFQIVTKCAERADTLLREMETRERDPSKRNRTRPDHLSYESVYHLCFMAGNDDRANVLREKLSTVRTTPVRKH